MLGTLGHLPVVLASLTGPLVTLATNVIGSLGYAGVALMCATSGVVGLPGTEPTMLFAGFNVYQGKLTLVGIIIAGIVGDTIGASVAYVIGHRASRELTRVVVRAHTRGEHGVPPPERLLPERLRPGEVAILDHTFVSAPNTVDENVN